MTGSEIDVDPNVFNGSNRHLVPEHIKNFVHNAGKGISADRESDLPAPSGMAGSVVKQGKESRMRQKRSASRSGGGRKVSSERMLTAVDLFSGCGGLSYGLKKARFKVLAAVEIDTRAQSTYKLNHPTVRLYEQDICFLDPISVMNDVGLKPGELDLLACCPPCQGFSRLRTRNRKVSIKDDRNDLISEIERFVRVMKPKTMMLENVPSLAKDRRFARLRNQVENLGYKIIVSILDAADYKVPQRRKRLIMLASRVHAPVVAPKAHKHLTVREALSGLDAPSRTKDALHRLPEKRSRKVRELIAMIPKDGGSRSDIGAKHQLECHRRLDGFKDVYGRMSWDDVSPTITGGCHNPSKGRFLHPSRNRTVTLRESALLQGFPADYKFDVVHGKEAIAAMIGNALPPPFIAAHANALRTGLLSAVATPTRSDPRTVGIA